MLVNALVLDWNAFVLVVNALVLVLNALLLNILYVDVHFARMQVLFISAHVLFVPSVLFVSGHALLDSAYVSIIMSAHLFTMSAAACMPVEQLTRLKRHATRRTCKSGTVMYELHVLPEVSPRYRLAADAARDVVRVRVLHPMLPQRAVIGERLGALIARKTRTLVRRRVRRPLVLFKRPRIRVAFVTLVACVRFLTSVGALMLATRPVVSEPHATDVTGVRSLSSVSEHVVAQMTALYEALAADVASVRAFTGVRAEVLVQFRLRRFDSATNAALEDALGRLNGRSWADERVSGQRAGAGEPRRAAATLAEKRLA